MPGLQIMKTGISRVGDLAGSPFGLGFGTGNVYYVIKTTEAHYQSFLADHSQVYTDGTEAVHNTIQSALDVTVDNRNDYVLLMPSQDDYDITATLTMSKKSVHLISPGGLGNSVGSTNATRIHMTSSLPLITLSDSAIEIAGCYFKNATKQVTMQLASSSYALNVHNNNFMWTTTSTDGEPVVTNIVSGTNDGGSWGTFEANWFTNVAGGSATLAELFKVHGNAKNFRIKYNEFSLSDAFTVTVGIDQQAVGGTVDFNTFRGDADVSALWVNCINLAAKATAIGNRAAVGTGRLFSGGTASANFCDSMDGSSGGTIVEA